jgi:hypothetical protein
VGSLIYVCSLFSLRSWQVLRSYDTRLRATERRPLLYVDDSANGTSMACPGSPVATQVLLVADDKPATELLEFGDPSPLSPVDAARDWLWRCQGKLLVIAIPYIKGRHYATRPTDFSPIIDHLESLHSCGYVHGDIRAYNMVFEVQEHLVDKQKGCLIDFDFGGKLVPHETEFKASDMSVKYPANYTRKLDDGDRSGHGGEPIEFFDDWCALVRVILLIHKVTKAVYSPNDVNLLIEEKYLTDMGGVSSFANQIEMQNFVDRLKEFLKAAETADWVVNMSRDFARSLDGLVKPDAKSKDMAATGSPPP